MKGYFICLPSSAWRWVVSCWIVGKAKPWPSNIAMMESGNQRILQVWRYRDRRCLVDQFRSNWSFRNGMSLEHYFPMWMSVSFWIQLLKVYRLSFEVFPCMYIHIWQWAIYLSFPQFSLAISMARSSVSWSRLYIRTKADKTAEYRAPTVTGRAWKYVCTNMAMSYMSSSFPSDSFLSSDIHGRPGRQSVRLDFTSHKRWRNNWGSWTKKHPGVCMHLSYLDAIRGCTRGQG